MEYSAEDLSPVKKKIVITTEPQEVEAAIMGAVALYKTSVQLDGFRKGKVPASVIEQRFRDKIYEEARQDLINVHINEVMQNLDVQPLSGINVDGAEALERGKGYTYSIEFEVLPTFDLPPYEGMEVEQEKVEVKEQEVADVIERIRRDRAQLVQRQNREPELVAALEDQHHHIALSDAEALEIRGRAVAFALDVGKGEPDFGALVVGPQQRLLAGLLGGVCVHHVVAEIEILRNPYVQVLPVILLRDEGGLG